MSSRSAVAVSAFRRLSSNSGLMVLLCMLLCAAPAIAQQTLGSVNGTVTDSSGAVVPKAAVKVRALATNLESYGGDQARWFVQHRRFAHRHLRSHFFERWLSDGGLSRDYCSGQSHGDGKREAQSGQGVVHGDGRSDAAAQ